MVELNKNTFLYYSSLKEYADQIDVANNVMSSHWRKFSEQALIYNEDKKIKFKTVGLDDFQNYNFINLVRNIPSQIYLKKLTKTIPKIIYKALLDVAMQHKRILSYNCVRQALSLNKIIKSGIDIQNMVVGIIGDGHGFMGCLLKKIFPSIQIVQINLPKNLILDFIFSTTFKEDYSFNCVLDNYQYSAKSDFTFIPADLIFNVLPKNIDLFINIASMGEMDKKVVDEYFHFMRQQKTMDTYFYCCNRKEKILPDGTNTIFSEYGWHDKDLVICDEICEWYNHYPINHPPFIRPFDGIFYDKIIKFYK